MTVTNVFTVVSHHYSDDHSDFEIVEFVTDNQEYAIQWVYAACRVANDRHAYSYDYTEMRTV